MFLVNNLPRYAALLAVTILTACTTISPDQATLKASAARIKADMAFLADDALKGREAGTEGYDVAAVYVADQYQALRLKPAAADGSFFQQVNLRAYKRNPEKMAMRLSGDDANLDLTYIDDFLTSNSAKYENKTITGDLVFVGYGLDAPDYGYTDYQDLDVAGKIIVMLGTMPENIPSEIRAHYKITRMKTAGAAGAIGVLTVYAPGFEKRLPWKHAAQLATSEGVTWVDENGTAKDRAPGIEASAIMSPKASAMLFDGAAKSYQEIIDQMKADKNFKPEGFALNRKVSLSLGSTFRDTTSRNVVAMLEGSDPTLKHEYVILSAHLDHIGLAHKDDMNGDIINNGAMDNASGTATMLEAARSFLAEEQRPRRSIIFAAVTAEEKGLIGSDYLAQHPLPGGTMVANVNLDMPLILYPFEDVIAFGAEHSTLEPIVRRATERMGVSLTPDPVPQMNLFVRSDHYSFVKQGVPSVFLFLGFANGGEKIFKKFMSTNYHDVGDDLSQKIDYYQGARFAKINYLIAKEIADANQKPEWNEGDVFGDLFGR